MKYVKEKETKCYLNTTEVLLMLMDVSLPKFDIYQGTVAPNCFKSQPHKTLDVLIFFKKSFV